jgi:hypothetical protein
MKNCACGESLHRVNVVLSSPAGKTGHRKASGNSQSAQCREEEGSATHKSSQSLSLFDERNAWGLGMWKNHGRLLGQTNLGVPIDCLGAVGGMSALVRGWHLFVFGWVRESKSNTQIVPCGTDVLTDVSFPWPLMEKAWNGTFFFPPMVWKWKCPLFCLAFCAREFV